MIEPPLSEPAGAPTALTAFLRGIERRGAVFADLHCGDPVSAERSYAVALGVFHATAAGQPFAYWPRLFWRALLAAPGLRAGSPNAAWPEAFAALGEAGRGPRAALLLRLVAGLGDADAAGVLGVAPATYRLALRRALPRRPDDSPDPDAWRALDAAVQELLRALPAERLAHLARLREAAAQGRRPELIGPLAPPSVQPGPLEAPPPHRRLRAVLWAGVVACGLALAASFVWPALWPAERGDPTIRLAPLPAAARPAARYDAATALLTEPDFELLAAQPGAMPDEPAFLAWVAAELARGEGERDPDAGMRDPLAADAAEALSTEPESIDAPF